MEYLGEYAALIDETRLRFETARASGIDFTDRYHALKKDFFERYVRRDKSYDALYADQSALYRKGQVVWAHMVQANEYLFKPSQMDLPACLIYSLEETIDGRPDVLADAAHLLFDLKGATADPDLQPFADKLADELVHDWKLEVPTAITDGIQCYYTTPMLYHRHLPGGYLASSLMPLLTCPAESDVCMVLPEKYWSSEFVNRYWFA